MFLEFYYHLKHVVSLHLVVKWFYYVVFAFCLLFTLHNAYYIWRQPIILLTLFFSSLISLLFFTPFLVFRFYFAALSMIILAYLSQSVIFGFQNIQLLLSSLLLMLALYSFLRYAILDIDDQYLSCCCKKLYIITV